ncbi:MAG: MBL fold metallo-hydrolase [Bacteroidota bacterium]
MLQLQSFVFNSFQENTYILYDENKECVIIDPGCYHDYEQKELTDFIKKEELKPVKFLNTHGHIDHVLGNSFVAKKYNIELGIHKDDLHILKSMQQFAHLYGLSVQKFDEPLTFLDEGDIVKFGNSSLEILFTPGHSPGSLCFVNKEKKNHHQR